jgi:hypothetical protein
MTRHRKITAGWPLVGLHFLHHLGDSYHTGRIVAAPAAFAPIARRVSPSDA